MFWNTRSLAVPQMEQQTAFRAYFEQKNHMARSLLT